MLKILKLIKICKFKVLMPSYLKKINRQETEMIFLSATKFKIIDYKDFIIFINLGEIQISPKKDL